MIYTISERLRKNGNRDCIEHWFPLLEHKVGDHFWFPYRLQVQIKGQSYNPYRLFDGNAALAGVNANIWSAFPVNHRRPRDD